MFGMVRIALRLLFVETLGAHEHGDQTTDAGVVSGSGGVTGNEKIEVRWSDSVVFRIQIVDGSLTVELKIRSAFAGVEEAEEKVGDLGGIELITGTG